MNNLCLNCEKYIKIFTFLDKNTIDSIIAEHQTAPHLRVLQKRLAEEITTFVHGKEELEKAIFASSAFFSPTMDDLKKQCDTLNKISEKITSAGLVAGYHNHNGEFEQKKDGRPDYDIILEQLDPTYVKMQFQVAAIQVGYKAADYFRKFPGRFISAHLSDFSVDNHNKQIVLGEKGLVDW